MTLQKLTLSLTAALVLTACGNSAVDTAQKTTPEPTPVQMTDNQADVKIKAVLIYADWCGSCKVLDPKVKAVQSANALRGVEFVTLDYTDKDETAFYAAAAIAGVESQVRAHLDGKVKTGQLLLINPDQTGIAGKVTKALSEAEIKTAIMTALKAA